MSPSLFEQTRIPGRSFRSLMVGALILLGGIFFATGVPVSAGEKYALLVGVKQYDKNELRNLPHSEDDVTALAETLKRAGYERVLLLTQTEGAKQSRQLPLAENIRKSVKGMLEDREADDTVLFAFAGHGVQFPGVDEHYFCPMDAKLKDKRTLIELTDLYRQLETCQAGVKLMLVDACRNDPQSDSSRALSEVRLESVTRPQRRQPPGGVAAFFSCSAGEKAYESTDLKHGIFFHFVLEGLDGKADYDDDKQVDLDELTKFTKRKVSDRVKDEFGDDIRQMPELVGKTRGTVSLIDLSKLTGGKPLPLTPPPSSTKGPPQQYTSKTTGMKFALIPAGEFTMGSPASEADRLSHEYQHQVRISQPFYMGVYEVTQGEYESVMGANPAYFSSSGKGSGSVSGQNTSKLPVDSVSWNDAVAFCQKLSEKDGVKYRLPTEAEWEYAARAGTTTPFHFGSTSNGDKANVWGDIPYGTATKGPFLGRPTTVGSYSKNAFGLFDVHGNVCEWCEDVFDFKAYASRSGTTTDPKVTSGPKDRVLRGGSEFDNPKDARSAHRHWHPPDKSTYYFGFRVVSSSVGVRTP